MRKLVFHWSSEIYGLGKTYRKLYKIPRFLPLPFYSDHGVIASGVIDQNIIESPISKKLFLTFSKSILEKKETYKGLEIIGQVHPWVTYKEKNNITRKEKPKYVLFFPLHTTSGYQVSGMRDDESLKILSLMKDRSEVRICLHWNDFGTHRHRFFVKNGFEVFTLGDPMKDSYVDIFYEYAINAKYAISESWTSGIALLVDLGVPCTILPRELFVTSTSEKNSNVGFANPAIKRDIQESEHLFEVLSEVVTSNQYDFVREHLGYQYKKSTFRNAALIYSHFLTSIPSWIYLKSKSRGSVS